jgi:hypothetical protein
MSDEYKYEPSGLDSPAAVAATITPSDSVDLLTSTRSIYIGGAGNLAVVLVGMTTPVTFTGVVAGMIYPFRVSKVMASGTTATGLVGLR